jgi:hypothetical protein
MIDIPDGGNGERENATKKIECKKAMGRGHTAITIPNATLAHVVDDVFGAQLKS